MEHYKNYSLENIDGEIWLGIPNYTEQYQASNFGRIKYMQRVVTSGNGAKQNLIERIMHQVINGTGYCATTRTFVFNGKQTNLVHRLVANCFLTNENNYSDINHISGVKTDNTLSNLEWCSRSQNLIHAVKLMGHYSGVKSGKSKFSQQDVVDIFNAKGTHREIAEKYKVSHSVIGFIKRKQSYKSELKNINESDNQ